MWQGHYMCRWRLASRGKQVSVCKEWMRPLAGHYLQRSSIKKLRVLLLLSVFVHVNLALLKSNTDKSASNGPIIHSNLSQTLSEVSKIGSLF